MQQYIVAGIEQTKGELVNFTQVYGFDRSVSAKAAWKARKAHKPLDNS